MATTAREKVSIPSDLRGASRVAIDATVLMTRLVETMHHNILRTPGVLGTATYAPTRGITGLVYQSVRGVTRLVGSGLDVSLAALQPLLGAGSSWRGRETVLAVVNGVLGDYLERSRNPLAIEMQLRHDGAALELTEAGLTSALPQATGKVVVLVHGLCMSDRQWTRKGHDHGRELAQDLGYTPVYVRYNSGLHISTSGRQLAALLEALIRHWPVPIEDFVIIGHSMGGLVARSAVHYARRGRRRWTRKLRRLVFVGTPHHGAPLERGGAWVGVLFGVSPYTTAFTHLGRVRSAGITDLRHGSLVDEDWEGIDRFAPRPDGRKVVPLPDGVQCHAIAGLTGNSTAGAGARLVGDGLVPLDSALGRHRDPARALAIAEDHQWIGRKIGHLELLSSRRVYAQIRQWLEQGGDACASTVTGSASARKREAATQTLR
jgi:pimeloyl-ACP methyl ester carboxylesterase